MYVIKLNLIAFFLLGTTNFILATRVTFHNCDDNLPVQLKDLTFTGGNATAIISIGEVINEGTRAKAMVKLRFLRLFNKDFDICEEAKKMNNPQISCPIFPGDYTISRPIPRNIPKGKFDVNVRAFDAAGNEMSCVDLNVDTRK